MHKKILILSTLLILCTIPVQVGATWAPILKGGDENQQEFVRYAWSISQDVNWILTIARESGFSLGAISPLNSDGSRDRGIMQLNSRYHGAFISSPEFGDYKHQLLYGAEVYARSGGKAFNGYFKRWQVYNRFIWFSN